MPLNLLNIRNIAQYPSKRSKWKHNSPTTTPPQRRDTAAARTYFTAILCDFHSVPEEEANGVASNWRSGRGSELIFNNVETLRTMFGPEAGTLLYGYARREWRTACTAPSSGLGKGERLEKSKVGMLGLEPGCEIFLILHKNLYECWSCEVSLVCLFVLAVRFGGGAWAHKGDESIAAPLTALAVFTSFLYLVSYLIIYCSSWGWGRFMSID